MSYTPNRADLHRLETDLSWTVGTHECAEVAAAVGVRVDPEVAEALDVAIRTAVTDAIIAQHRRITERERSERR